MPPFEDALNSYWDTRISTLARIKTRSVGADSLVLSALTVLTYAQLEGGVKEISACVIKDINARNMEIGEVAPRLLTWRNEEDLARFRSLVDFEMIGVNLPFASLLKKKLRVRPINRYREFNQMNWAALKRIYKGFGLDPTTVERSSASIDQLVDARNEVAHHGVMPKTTGALLERSVRHNVAVVETVLTDLSFQMLSFFPKRLHKR